MERTQDFRTNIQSQCQFLGNALAEWKISDAHQQLSSETDDSKWILKWLSSCQYHRMIHGTRTVVCQLQSSSYQMFALKPCFIPATVPQDLILKSSAFLEVAMNVFLARQFPHITQPVLSLLCKSDLLKRQLWKFDVAHQKTQDPEYRAPSYRNWKSKLPFEQRQKKKSDLVLLHLVEWVDGGALFDYCHRHAAIMCNNVPMWISFLGQMCVCLASILERFGNWRHNDCHLGNWLIRPVSPDHVFEYTVRGQKIRIPSYGCELLLWDFEHATLEGQEQFYNPLIHQYGEFGMSCTPNTFFDLHTMLNAFLIEHHSGLPLPSEVKAFLFNVIPDAYRISASVRCGRLSLDQQKAALLDRKVPYASPIDLVLHHPFFESIHVKSTPAPPQVIDVEMEQQPKQTVPRKMIGLEEVLELMLARHDQFNFALATLAAKSHPQDQLHLSLL